MVSGIYAIIVLFLVGLFLVLPAKQFGYLSAVSIFFYAQTIMGLGILPLLDAEVKADIVHARIIAFTLAIYTVTVTIASIVRSVRHSSVDPEIRIVKPGTGVWLMVGLSIAISTLYFMAVGYMAFLETIRGLFSGNDVDAATLRLESYSGSNYYFPGYVNQFKNSLLPALVVVIVHFLFASRARFRIQLSSLLIVSSTLFLLGTGQRGAFVTFALIAVVYVYLAIRRRFKTFTIWIGGMAIGIFFISTAASGRASTDLQSAGSGGERIVVLFEQLIFRLSGSNQRSAVAGFRYIYDLPVQNGGQWFQSFVGLLPGAPGSDLDNQIFGTIYGGSTRGTAPPSAWGSIYHNFGVIGCFVLAIALGLILVKISTLTTNYSIMNTFQAIGIAGMTVISGSWIAGAPVYFLNTGVVIYALLWLYGNRLEKARYGTTNSELSKYGPESRSLRK